MFGKKDLAIENAKLEVKLEFLSKENAYLKNKLDELQKTLISKISPMAYSDLIYKETKESETDIQNKEELKFLKEYSSQIEKPLFNDADEMMSKISSMIGFDPPKSLHDNQES